MKKKRSKIQLIYTVLGIAFAVLATQTNPTYAYNLLGWRWNGTPTSGCCAELRASVPSDGWADGVGGPDSRAFTISYVNWSNNNQLNVPRKSNVNWTTEDSRNLPALATDTTDPSVTWDGLTDTNANSGIIATSTVYLNHAYTHNYNFTQIDGVAAHEIGHQMGLDHSPGCVLMVPDTPTRLACGISIATDDDLDGIAALY